MTSGSRIPARALDIVPGWRTLGRASSWRILGRASGWRSSNMALSGALLVQDVASEKVEFLWLKIGAPWTMMIIIEL